MEELSSYLPQWNNHVFSKNVSSKIIISSHDSSNSVVFFTTEVFRAKRYYHLLVLTNPFINFLPFNQLPTSSNLILIPATSPNLLMRRPVPVLPCSPSLLTLSSSLSLSLSLSDPLSNSPLASPWPSASCLSSLQHWCAKTETGKKGLSGQKGSWRMSRVSDRQSHIKLERQCGCELWNLFLSGHTLTQTNTNQHKPTHPSKRAVKEKRSHWAAQTELRGHMQTNTHTHTRGTNKSHHSLDPCRHF